MSKPKFCYGGQAVIEGVMMRGQKTMAVAIRKPDGGIMVEETEIKSNPRLPKFLKWPFIRGTVNLVSSLTIGVKTLVFSANQALDEGEEEETLSPLEITGTVALSLALGVGLFFLLPAFLAQAIKAWVPGHGMQNVMEGLVRILIFLTYMFLISRVKDVQRVFQYHGAEHKTIFNYESGKPLAAAAAREMSRFHPRCGTSFLLFVMVISILVYSVLPEMSMIQRLLSRVILLPVIAGIAYEVIRLAGNHLDHPLVAAISWPGMQLQRLTTQEPDDSQLEVAIAALKSVLKADGELAEEPVPLQGEGSRETAGEAAAAAGTGAKEEAPHDKAPGGKAPDGEAFDHPVDTPKEEEEIA